MQVAIDLAHSPAWTAGPAHKSGVDHGRAELGWLGHLSGIVTELFGVDDGVVTIDEPWTDGALAGVGVLLLPAVGRDEDRPFTAVEAGMLAALLDGGGGVLVFGDGDRRAPGVDRALLAGTVPFALGDDFAVATRRDADHLLTYDIEAEVAGEHPVTTGVAGVFVHRARPVLADGARLTPLVTHGGDVLAAAGMRGRGRVVVLGNAELFGLPFLGRRDNLRFLLNALSWLAGGDTVPAAAARAATDVGGRTFGARTFDPREDVTRTEGPHVVDVGAYRDTVRRCGEPAMPDPHEDIDAFLDEAHLRFHELPRRLRQAVGGFRSRSNDYGILLVRGLPLDPDLPPTPADPHRPTGTAPGLSELWLAAFASALGSPFAYQQEQSGALYQNVIPTPGNATNISSESSAIELGFHTEMGFHPYPPDYVLLLCLRPDHDRAAKTITSSVRMTLPELTLRERAILFEPLYRPGIDYSFGSPNGKKGNGPAVPVLYGDPYDPCMNFDFDLMVGLSDEADAAVRALRAATNRARRWVKLSAGDLLIIDNRRAAHARSAFTARYDGQDRWLRRMCVMRDLVPCAADRRAGDRVVETRFAV
jgi:hypothetical protein